MHFLLGTLGGAMPDLTIGGLGAALIIAIREVTPYVYRYFTNTVSPMTEIREQLQDCVDDRKRLHLELDRLTELIYPAAIVADTNGRIVEWLGFAEKMFGYTLDEAVGMDVSRIIPITEREQHTRSYLAAIDRGGLSEPPPVLRHAHGLRKDGTLVPIRIELTLVSREPLLFGVEITRRAV